MIKKRHVLIIIALCIIALLFGAGVALAYTHYLPYGFTGLLPSYDTIIPLDDWRRSSEAGQSACNGGFSPNPCVGTIPEPSTYALFGVGLAGLVLTRRCNR